MNKVAFVWDNYGPMHLDRCEAVQKNLGEDWRVLAVEQYSSSHEYEWDQEQRRSVDKVTLFQHCHRQKNLIVKVFRIIKELRSNKVTHVFFCNWDRSEIFLSALLSRIFRLKVYVMGCSKFDDAPRLVWRELFKSLGYLPYKGGISSGGRGIDYLKYMGIPDAALVGPYNTLSIERIRKLAGLEPAPNGTLYKDRYFLVVARFVNKKNLPLVINAYAIYRSSVDNPRKIYLCGSGILEEELRKQVRQLNLGEFVVFNGFLQSSDVAKELGRGLALILPSIEEQFGNVVIEAQAMGLPVLVSDRCGARDQLVRTAVNGFIFEPDNVEGLAFFMKLLHEDEELWRKMCQRSFDGAGKGDVKSFASAVVRLVGG